ncbi:hypothetical protein [Arthrobacter sp. ISL-95]|uniref:hypothetical protein n=1 Tax=Arthrobacter sp. ISL-95 TaxID=2819116 RepID=UPI001BE94BAF|nr:hypothetical protein [Arthrobacter sp. ISL-95]MBT2585386.1 hypothetical protein [Arthrobacter sp. ISL-95]
MTDTTKLALLAPFAYEKGEELPPMEWRRLEEGRLVLVQLDNGPILAGEVDEATDDATVFWVWLERGLGRLAVFDDDNISVWLPKGYQLRT